MNNVINFFSYQQKQVRVIIKDGEPWWVAKDVCDILEINNSRQAITRLDEDEKNTVIINDGTSGNPNKTIINEPGLYTLILTSRKPEAKEFKRWITHEVIPSIRKTGKYNINNNKITPLDAFKQLIKVLDEQNERIEQLENKQEKQTKQIDMINTTITVENHTTQRQMFVAAVKRLAYEKEQSIAQTYKYIYKIINNNLKINIQVRAKHRNCKPIDVLEQDNLLEYALRIVNNELNKVA